MPKRIKESVEDPDVELETEEPEIEDDLGVPDSDDDLGDFNDDDFDELDEEGGGRGRRSSVDDLKAIELEVALRANPKRGQSQRKGALELDGASLAELNTPETAKKVWKRFEKTHGKEKARAYKVHNDYSLEDIINHPTFGRGYVVEILSNTKCSVLFADGLRRLMYNLPKK